jgi:hypothetical protein
VHTVSNSNLDPLIAYLVPGATALMGLGQFSPTLVNWLLEGGAGAPTIGGFLYLTLASIAVGMIVNAVRWAVVDTLNSLTGLALPALNFSKLGRNVEAFSLLIYIHYRHYQFNANVAVASACAFICYRVKLGAFPGLGWPDIAFAALEVTLLATARDNLRKYYSRSRQLLGELHVLGR